MAGGALAIAGAFVVVGGREARDETGPEAWTALVETGDALAAGATPSGRPGRPATPRVAYLLAFHVAQDAGDPEHVLAVADRLDALGESGLSAHVRRAAASLLAEAGAGGPPGER